MISCTGYVCGGTGTDEVTEPSSGKTQYPVPGETCCRYYDTVVAGEELKHNLAGRQDYA